jgi:16S rRNA (adenine1518-N6/adenine1519-N6)-dimethyltransferase
MGIDTREVVKKYDFKFTKSLGQNFLIDDTVLKDIVSGAEVSKDDVVIEIGPGVGTLTKELLDKAKHVYAIEIDEKLIPILKEELKEYDNFTLIYGDALKVNFHELIGDKESVKVVANLPYYVTTPIVLGLLAEDYNFKSLTIMIQKEVAERMNAVPGNKDYGSLSLLVQYYCKTEIIRIVPPSSFIPRPKVDSIVIRLDKLSQPSVSIIDKDLMFKVIRASFNMRRKTLSNALANVGLSKDKLNEAFAMSNIDPKRRGETLSLEEFAFLTECIKKLQ